ncbi:MAG TPA: heptaprenyl diphosphate synthase [Acholeplasmatales bacterium]|nr:heptaprenyl diphosphate synthase [Acholeplasmatales bacterium]
MALRKTVTLAVLIAVSIVLSIVESMISTFVFIIPGVKLGLANIVTLIVLYIYGPKEAGIVAFLRIILVVLLSPAGGGLFSPTSFMSFAGGTLAYVAMIAMKAFRRFSILSVSVAGSLFHMVGQIGAAIFVLETAALIYYLPYMILIAVPTGIFTGLVGKKLVTVFQNRASGNIED